MAKDGPPRGVESAAGHAQAGRGGGAPPIPPGPTLVADDPGRRRRILPHRRALDLVNFKHGEVLYKGGAGRFADGTLAELWLNAAKPNSPIDNCAHDAAILMSLLLQHGVPVAEIKHSLKRNPDGGAAGPIGMLLDLIEGATC